MDNRSSNKGLRILASLLANAAAILSANYIVFYILDHYNPGLHFVIHSTFPVTQYLYWIIPALAVLSGLLYLILFSAGSFDRHAFNKKRFWRILILDVVAAAAVAMVINTHAFDWLHLRAIRQENIVAIATPTPSPTPDATPSSEAVTDAPSTPSDPDATPAPTDIPTETPEPTATPIPGLLGDKYADKFTDGEAVIAEPNTEETLADGTVKTLLYTYASNQVVVEISHYRRDKLEYQIADLYVRDMKFLAADYALGRETRFVPDYARDLNAVVAVNSDYFANNSNNEGLVIRNGNLLKSDPCRTADLCVIFMDGTMRCYDCKTDTIDNEAIIASFPYHSFYFGPTLLNADGSAKESFNLPDSIGAPNPRTAIGYYEPGHYAFICVLGARGIRPLDGKNADSKSPGMNLKELSQLCASLGMQAAYNLDGGGSSSMFWNEKLFGHNTRTTSDIISVVDAH